MLAISAPWLGYMDQSSNRSRSARRFPSRGAYPPRSSTTSPPSFPTKAAARCLRLGRDENLLLDRDHPESTVAVVVERLTKLVIGVHDERSVPRDRLADRCPTEQQNVELGAARLLTWARRDFEVVAATEHHQLTRLDCNLIARNRARA